MANPLRVVESSPIDRLAHLIAVQNGLTPEEGREEAWAAVHFFSALLDLPEPEHAETQETTRAA